MIVCNTRNLMSRLTGVQRYTGALLELLKDQVEAVQPGRPLPGMAGHAWEQVVLPLRLRGRLLWSPSTSGPVGVEKQVISLMDMSTFDHPEWFSEQYVRWYRFLMPRLVHRARAIITISEFSKSRILHHFPSTRGRVHVTPLGVDQRFSAQPRDVAQERCRSLGLPSRHYLLCLGSVTARKNVAGILKAWSVAARRLPDDVWLILVGDRPDARIFGDFSLQTLPERVFFTGHVDDAYLPALYSGATASVYLSLYEGFGLPPLESMACATPVIAARSTSIPEVVGDAAMLVDPLRTDEIADAMLRVVEDTSLRAELSARGLAQAGAFSWQRTAAETAAILKRCDH